MGVSSVVSRSSILPPRHPSHMRGRAPNPIGATLRASFATNCLAAVGGILPRPSASPVGICPRQQAASDSSCASKLAEVVGTFGPRSLRLWTSFTSILLRRISVKEVLFLARLRLSPFVSFLMAGSRSSIHPFVTTLRARAEGSTGPFGPWPGQQAG